MRPNTMPRVPPVAAASATPYVGGQGSAEGMGICHSYTPGGRSLDAPGLAAQLVQPMLLATPAAVPQQGQLF